MRRLRKALDFPQTLQGGFVFHASNPVTPKQLEKMAEYIANSEVLYVGLMQGYRSICPATMAAFASPSVAACHLPPSLV
jgi:hypothetical protein